MFSVFPSRLFQVHNGQENRTLSPRLWNNLRGAQMAHDGLARGCGKFEDFLSFNLTTAVASNVGRYVGDAGGYVSYEDTGDAIAQLATVVGGQVKVTTAATDNNETWIQPGSATTVIGKISDTGGEDNVLIFEARFAVGQITAHNVFIGMSEEGLAAADTITDAGALASKDLIGFWILEGAPTSLVYGYRKAGQTAQTVGTYGTAVAADTFYNVGFIYNPAAPAAEKIKFYVNNELQSSKVTATNIAAATFPDGEELNVLAGIKNGAAAAKTLTLDSYAAWAGV